MENLRKYGKKPFNFAVVHGGPGAGGEMAPVACELSRDNGVLEPIQTALSVSEQVEELRTVLENESNFPVALIGFSWGAWLSFMLASKYPDLVKKLILVSSGPFEEKYAEKIQETRLSRLSKEDKEEIKSLIVTLNNPETKNQNSAFARFGKLFSKADVYDPITEEPGEKVFFRADIFQNVWKEAVILRKDKKLLQMGEHIRCPVVAIHGDYDPHPAEGVQRPLTTVLKDFKFILLENCGHMPWIERQGRERFYQILREENV